MTRVVLGMIGLGTVGSGVVRLLAGNKQLALKKIAVKDPNKQRTIQAPCELTTDVQAVINDPEIEVLIEVMGGEQPALQYIEQAIEKHKHVVTANKEVLAKHGPYLFEKARKKGVAIFFEASVAGGLPLISTMQKGLEANDINSVVGILNGTTNYILTKMANANESFAAALKTAQDEGYAEADPTSDVDGFDVAYKLSILSALAYGKFVDPKSIHRESIRNIEAMDIENALDLGYTIKLIGITRKHDEKSNNESLDVCVSPMLVPLKHPLSSVSLVNNGILVQGSAVGEIIMVGPGAGQLPTASAIVGDTINLASALKLPDFATYFQPEIGSTWAELAPQSDFRSPYYLRLEVDDTPGVIGQIGTIFGNNNVSIRSLIQKDVHGKKASIVVVTHEVSRANMEATASQLKKCSFLLRLANKLPIFAMDDNHA